MEPAGPDNAHALPTHCENCGAGLRGVFCHACGQSVRSPLRHAGHAIEEVFESFWHLDGRIFRTLRELLFPGLVANAYLAGHRARYVAPLRLFVILSVITFFVAQWSLQVPPGTEFVKFDAARPGTTVTVETLRAQREARTKATAGFAAMATIVAVEQARDAQLADLDAGAKLVGRIPRAKAQIDAQRAGLNEAAAARIVELGGVAPTVVDPAAAALPAKPPAKGTATLPTAGSSAPAPDATLWSSDDTRIESATLPPFVVAWANRQLDRANHNALRIQATPEVYVHALISAVPSTLFVLVPVFALLLKLLYFFKRRLYLEHLVVALYSHAFLLLSLLAIFLSMLVRHHVQGIAGPVLSFLEALLWAWMPIYLLLMQKAVYRQGWPMTLVKFSALAFVYSVLLTFGAAATALVSLVRL